MRTCGCVAVILPSDQWQLALLTTPSPEQPCLTPTVPTHTQKSCLSGRSISGHDLLELNDVQSSQCCFICFLMCSRCHKPLATAPLTHICGKASGFVPTLCPRPSQHSSARTFVAELTDMVRALAVHLHVVRNISRAQHLATHMTWNLLLVSYCVRPQSILRSKSCLTFLTFEGPLC